MNCWLRGIALLLAVMLSCDGLSSALTHSHDCAIHKYSAVVATSHDSHHACQGQHALGPSESNARQEPAPPPFSPAAPDDGCAACRYLVQSSCLRFTPDIETESDLVARFLPPMVESAESSVLLVHYSRGPPAGC